MAPPRISAWLVQLLQWVTSKDAAAAVVGDALEEWYERTTTGRLRGRGTWWLHRRLGGAVLAAIVSAIPRVLRAWGVTTRDAVRMQVRSHVGFRVGLAGVIALCVGINVTVAAHINALWFKSPPVVEPDRIVAVLGTSRGWFTPRDHETFAAVAGQVVSYLGFEPNLRVASLSAPLETIAVTPGYFSLFGLQVRGRDLREDDDRPGAEPVAIISHQLWSQIFDGRDDVIGHILPMAPIPFRVIGVAPKGFNGARRGERTDVWIPRSVLHQVLRVP